MPRSTEWTMQGDPSGAGTRGTGRAPAGKIFCIGLQKTGTTSIEKALKALGYTVCGEVTGYRADLDDRERLKDAIAKAKRFDAFNDFPWNIYFRELDRRFPRSKFILTVREREAWLRSCRRQYARFRRPALDAVFGATDPVRDEARFVRGYERHVRQVRDYFARRPGDLLVMNLAEGGNWRKLCSFLGRAAPPDPFPRAQAGGTLVSLVQRNAIGLLKEISYRATNAAETRRRAA